MALVSRPLIRTALSTSRKISTEVKPKKEGDISSVFVSLSGQAAAPLPPRFAEVKHQLMKGTEEALLASWRRLLNRLKIENKEIAQRGSDVIPRIHFDDLHGNPDKFQKELKRRGVGVIQEVVPVGEARSYKFEVEDYIRENPTTKAFPAHDPQVFELYWSPSQVKARAHPNVIEAQKFLMNSWHSRDPDAVIASSVPLAYADRVRIRKPGDAGFALGPHVDGGSVERFEPNGYGLGNVYQQIWDGNWEAYDPWESSCRISAVSDLYAGAGACSMFRMFQGWLGLSNTAPKEGTLMVNPLLQLSTAYFLLRPFFTPLNPAEPTTAGSYSEDYLDASNWVLQTEPTSEIQGANPGSAQELNTLLHPHLDLARTMVHIPVIQPGDYVVWHCDTIHAVDKLHMGTSDSSVMYIPVCPVTESNAAYLKLQRDAFLNGTPGPDFPGGKGESEHIGRPDAAYLHSHAAGSGLQAMGFTKLDESHSSTDSGANKAIARANEILGF